MSAPGAAGDTFNPYKQQKTLVPTSYCECTLLHSSDINSFIVFFVCK